MLNFEYHVPTKIIFGKDTHLRVGQIVSDYGFRKILLHYGMGSIKKSGVYDAVTSSLRKSGIEYVELGGAEPNPKLGLVKKGIELCKSENVEMVLAVGGGSVIDSAKLIAIGTVNEGDLWDFSMRKRQPKAALPVGTVLTLAASGSEMSSSCVITNEENLLKRGFNSPYNQPLFSICNPELTYTVNRYQTGCGIVDIMMHTMERYFSNSPDTPLTDRICEGLIMSVIEAGRKAVLEPSNYEARATLMWAGSLSHNGLTGLGRDVFMQCHQLEHELSGMYDHVAHGAGLAVIWPAWAKYVYTHAPDRFAGYARRVWGCESSDPMEAARFGIEATERYFAEIGMPTRLKDLGVGSDKFEEMAEKCTLWGARKLPGYVVLDKKEIIDIFELAK